MQVGSATEESVRTTWSKVGLTRWLAWAPIFIGPCLVVMGVPADWPRWAFMWLLAFAIYAGCKWLTWHMAAVPFAPIWRHVGYLLGWPGLDADAFLADKPLPRSLQCGQFEWLIAFTKFTAGVVILYAGVRFIPEDFPYIVGWVGMIGIVLTLHFGLFHLLSCGWRRLGVEARPLMNWPVGSTSLSDFWGRRWNTAFRDLTHRFLFRPLTPRLGPRGAVFAGFLFSGIVHDVVISWPALGGYGGPTAFFVLQGVGLLVERSRVGKAVGLGAGWRGGLFAISLLLAPAPLLFHRPFVENVVVPFLHALGAV